MFKNLKYLAILPVFLLLGVGSYIGTTAPVNDYDSSVVKVLVGSGHGSGVYIGDGVVLTAAHVVNGASDNKVKLRTESGNILEAEVLWVNKARDIAALRPTTLVGLTPSVLSCNDPMSGDKITARGNPGAAEFFTSHGYISDAKKHVAGPWKQAMTVDMSIAPGMSGGPVFNEVGNVIGLAVGVMTTSLGMAPSLTGVGIIVPGSAVCELLGR